MSESPTSTTTIALRPPIGFSATGGIAVIRVASLEVRPTLVATVDPAFLETRSPDGIPTSWDGEAAHRPAELAALVAAATDDRSFLVGGWIAPVIKFCVFTLPTRPTPNPVDVGAACGGAVLSDTPGVGAAQGIATQTIVRRGPALLRVHTRDPRASTCRNPSVCESAVVLDSIVWSGDSWTDGAPLDISQVVERLDGYADKLVHRSRIQVEPLRVRNPPGVRGAIVPPGCDYGIPPQAWRITNGSRTGRIFVYASTAERERFAPYFNDMGLSSMDADGSPCDVIADGALASHWVAVDNVLMEVRVGFKPTAADDELVANVARALRGETP